MNDINEYCTMSYNYILLQLPFGPPPILPDLGEQFEAYLTKPENLPLHNAKNSFKFWNREINIDSLYQVELSSVATTLKVRF